MEILGRRTWEGSVRVSALLPAALGHGAVNAYIGFGLLIVPAADEMMTMPFGLPAMLALLFIAVFAYVDLSRSIGTLFVLDGLSHKATSIRPCCLA